MDAKTVALAGGSGFIGRAIARRLLASGQSRVRVLTRDPESARAKLDIPGVEFVRADIAQPASLVDALKDANTVVDAIQFDGYPVENPRRGLTFERIDYGGVVALIDAAKQAGVQQFIYVSPADGVVIVKTSASVADYYTPNFTSSTLETFAVFEAICQALRGP